MANEKPRYDDREIQAVQSVFIEIGQVLGAFSQKFVVVGGAVPWLLFPDGDPPHVGTTDIDLNLDPEALSDGEYATLVETLQEKGYERDVDDLKPFQMRRWVKVDEGKPVSVLVDLLMPRGSSGDANKEKLLANFRVQGIDGGQIALTHNVIRTVHGRMPDGRDNSVELLVATIPALLVMKGYAITGRDKEKDAYDIYYSVRSYETGPRGLADDCRELLDIAEACKGFQKLASKFRHPQDFGPQTVRRFCVDHNALGDLTPEQIQRDAFGQLEAFVSHLGLPTA